MSKKYLLIILLFIVLFFVGVYYLIPNTDFSFNINHSVSTTDAEIVNLMYKQTEIIKTSLRVSLNIPIDSKILPTIRDLKSKINCSNNDYTCLYLVHSDIEVNTCNNSNYRGIGAETCYFYYYGVPEANAFHIYHKSVSDKEKVYRLTSEKNEVSVGYNSTLYLCDASNISSCKISN